MVGPPALAAPVVVPEVAVPEPGLNLPSNSVDDSEAIKALNLGKPKKRRLGRGALWGMVLALIALVGGGGFWAFTANKVKTHPVPSLLLLPEGEARNLVSPFGFAVQTKPEKSDDTPTPGVVIAQDPPQGTMLKKGDSIYLTVSDGPKLAKLPDITKLTSAEAKKLLESEKLVYKEAPRVFDENALIDTVMSWTVEGQTLAVDSAVAKGTVVEAVVSDGPKPRQVPEIRSLNWEQAKATIEAAGLKAVRLEDMFSDKWAAGIVANIDPEIESELPRGGEVKIKISKGPDLVVVPNIYASSLTKAVEVLKEAGLEQGTIDGPIDRPVISCDPPPGTKVKRGTKVNLRLG